jgi:hypothetical protein
MEELGDFKKRAFITWQSSSWPTFLPPSSHSGKFLTKSQKEPK